MLTELLWDHKFMSDVTGCRKTQVSDCTGSTVHDVMSELNSFDWQHINTINNIKKIQ